MTYFPLPRESEPIRFYSTHCHDDLRLITLKALKKAQTSIHIHTYAMTDPQVLSLLMKKARSGVEIHVTYHQKNTPRLEKLPHLYLHPVKKSGLMHAKWMIIDACTIFLGTANLTSSSLMMHDNFLVGLYSPEFAKALITPSFFEGIIGTQNITFFLLPDPKGLETLLNTLDKTKERLAVALFTLTHPKLSNKLQELHERGIRVNLTLDQLGARGASKKTSEVLLEAGIPVKRNQGMPLFHHKWAFIDDTTFVIGSANWTKAAFQKNKDFILFISPLTKKQIKHLNNTVNIIKKESLNCN